MTTTFETLAQKATAKIDAINTPKRGRPKLQLSEIEIQQRQEKQKVYQQKYQERKLRGETAKKPTEEEKKQKKKEYTKHYYTTNKNRMLENAKKYRERMAQTPQEIKKINSELLFDCTEHTPAEGDAELNNKF